MEPETRLYDFRGVITFPAVDIDHADQIFDELLEYIEEKGFTAEGSVEEASLYTE